MQVTIDVPEPLYAELERRAALTCSSVAETLLEQACTSLRSVADPQQRRERVQLPLVPASAPGSIDLNRNLNSAFFDDLDPS